MKKSMKTTFISLLLALSALPVVGCDTQTTEEPTSTQSTVATAYVSVDINPSFEFLTDDEGVVITVRAANEDANVVLADMDLEGKDIKEVVAEVTAESEELGYLNEENTDVSVIVSADEEKVEEEITEKVEEGVTEGSDIAQVQPDETALSLAEEVEAYKAQDPELYAGLTVAKLKIAKSIMEYDSEFTVAQAAASSTRELARTLRDYARTYRYTQTQALKEKFEEAYLTRSAEIYEKIEAVYGEEYVALKGRIEALSALQEKYIQAFRDAEKEEAPEEGERPWKPYDDKFHHHFRQDEELTDEMKAEILAIVGENDLQTLRDLNRYICSLQRECFEYTDYRRLTDEQKAELRALYEELHELRDSIFEELREDIEAVCELYKSMKEERRETYGGKHHHGGK